MAQGPWSHPSSRYGPSGTTLPLLGTSGDYHWRPAQTGSLDLTVQPQWEMTSGGHQSKWVVCMLLECFLVKRDETVSD